VHLAERLADGRTGYVVRAHHAMLDGATMLAFLSTVLFDHPAEPGPPTPPAPWRPARIPTRRASPAATLRAVAAELAPIEPLGLLRRRSSPTRFAACCRCRGSPRVR
jgi:hypothetical protein